MNVHVQGGTGAGVRAPFEGAAKPWPCECWDTVLAEDGYPSIVGRTNPGYLVACPDCGERRP